MDKWPPKLVTKLKTFRNVTVASDGIILRRNDNFIPKESITNYDILPDKVLIDGTSEYRGTYIAWINRNGHYQIVFKQR